MVTVTEWTLGLMVKHGQHMNTAMDGKNISWKFMVMAKNRKSNSDIEDREVVEALLITLPWLKKLA